MSRQARFAKEHLDDLMSKDPEVQRYFRDTNGTPLTREDPLHAQRARYLEDALEHAYTQHAQNYDKNTFMQRYVATPLRTVGAGTLYSLGALTFLANPLSAAGLLGSLGYTFYGTLASSLADLFDYHAYTKTGRITGLGTKLKLAGESLLEKAVGYFPFGGLIDLYRGRKKFESAQDQSMKPTVHRIVEYAKHLFKQHFTPPAEEGTREEEKEGKIIPLAAVKDHQYARQRKKAA